MAQTVQLKRSSVPGKVPTTSDLALGEIAINTYDGKVFTKKDDGTPSIVEIGAGAGGTTNLSTTANSSTVVVASDTGTDATLVGANSTTAGLITAAAQTIAGDKTFNGSVLLDNGAADEGGELRLAAAITNSSLSGPIAIDIYQNRLRIFETGGSNRGAYIDLTSAGAGVGSNLLTGGSSNTTPTNLSLSANGSTVSIFSDTGTDVVIPAANSTVAGVLTAEAQTIAGDKTFVNTITGSLSGNATTASALQTARTISLGGDLSGSASFDGSANVTITATIQPNSVALGTDTTGDYVSGLTGGTGVTISGSAGEGWTPTVAIGQDVSTTSNVQFNNLVISGNLTVNGTTTTISANNLAINDNMIYLNDGSTITNPDLGWVGNYNDGTYSHTGIFRDATDNRWRIFQRYTPEPGLTIDITDPSFQYADLQANTFYGALSGNATTATTLQTARTINGVSFNGSSNITITAANPNALTIGTGLSGTSYDGSAGVTIAIDSTVATLSGSQTLTNKTISSGILTGTLTANGSVGTSGQVLTSSGTDVYWATPTGGGGGGATNLSLSANSTTVSVFSDTGTDVVILGANSTTAGVITADTQTIGGSKTFSADVSFGANVAITGTVTSGIWNGEVMSRTVSYTDATSITINADTTDIATMVNTQATGTFTINAPTGSFYDGQKLMFRLKSTNVQTFSWDAAFAGSTDAPLPTASSGSSLTDYLGFIYDSTSTKWHVIAKNFGY